MPDPDPPPALNRLPHDINLLLLYSTAQNSLVDLESLAWTCRSLYSSFQTSKPSLLLAVLPNTSKADYLLLRRFARYLYSLNAFGLLWFGAMQQGRAERLELESKLQTISRSKWLDTLASFAVKDPAAGKGGYLYPNGVKSRTARLKLVEENPELITASDLLAELIERIVLKTATTVHYHRVPNMRCEIIRASFPLPRQKAAYRDCDAYEVVHWASTGGKWRWFAEVMGVWSGQETGEAAGHNWEVGSLEEGEMMIAMKRSTFMEWWRARQNERWETYRREEWREIVVTSYPATAAGATTLSTTLSTTFLVPVVSQQ